MTAAASFSFPKYRRLTQSSQFDLVKQKGRTRGGKLLLLRVVSVDNSGPCRIGFVTSRHLGGAVTRNRVRRRLRELVRLHQHHLRNDFWVVLVAKRDAVHASYRTLEDEWLRLAKRASILL
jgi:ribonuclease P protein component